MCHLTMGAKENVMACSVRMKNSMVERITGIDSDKEAPLLNVLDFLRKYRQTLPIYKVMSLVNIYRLWIAHKCLF